MIKIFELHQKLSPLANIYQVLQDSPTGLQQAAYVRQKRFALREKFFMYKDDSQSQAIAEVAANNVLDVAAAYSIKDQNQKYLGSVRKVFKASLLNSTWALYADEKMSKELFKIKEKSTAIAIIRRIWSLTPFIDYIPFPIKYHFLVLKDGQTVGEYTKLTLFKDHYALHMEESHAKDLDARVWMALAVLLDALEGR